MTKRQFIALVIAVACTILCGPRLLSVMRIQKFKLQAQIRSVDMIEISDLNETITSCTNHFIPPRLNVTPEHIRLLHNMLGDTDYKQHWPSIALLLAQYSTDVNSVPIIIDYIRRDDLGSIDEVVALTEETKDFNGFTELRNRQSQKIACITNLGRIGGPAAKMMLMEAVTEEGAIELGKAWFDSNGVPTEHVVRSIRYSAIVGLAFLQDSQADMRIEQLYKSEAKDSKASGKASKFLSCSTDAMAIRECIKDVGSLETYLILAEDHTVGLELLYPYIVKYSLLDELCSTSSKRKWYHNLWLH